MNVFIALPAFGGSIYAHAANGVIHLSHVLRDAGHQWVVEWVMGESLIPRARNTLVHKFLKTDCTHLLFIDCDLVFNARDVLGMLACDKELIGGAYPKKQLDVQAIVDAVERQEPDPMAFAANYAINVAPGEADANGDVTVTPDKGAIPVLDLPTGFMLVKRDVFLDMAAQMPEIEYDSDERSTKGEPMFAWFDCPIEDRRYLSEDYAFSRRCQRMGLKAWLYLPAVLGHVGTHVYRGDLSKTFKPVTQASSVSATGGATEWCDIPSLPDSDPQKRWHIERYEWAAKRIRGTQVVNGACGSGYGSLILERVLDSGWSTDRVLGLDRSQTAIDTAFARYARPRCLFGRVDDIETLALGGWSTLVSLETLEHLKDPWGWLSRLSPTVKELVASVPVIPTKHANPFHLHDFTTVEVLDKLAELGWDVKDKHWQDEYQPRAVLLVHATRP